MVAMSTTGGTTSTTMMRTHPSAPGTHTPSGMGQESTMMITDGFRPPTAGVHGAGQSQALPQSMSLFPSCSCTTAGAKELPRKKHDFSFGIVT